MKNFLMMLLFVIILGSILSTAIVVVNYYTSPIIKRNAELKLKSSVLTAFDIPYTKESLESDFDEKIETKDLGDERTMFTSKTGDIALYFDGPGLWGNIEGILSLDADWKTIKRIVVIFQEETPGLGSRIAEDVYLSGFRGKQFLPVIAATTSGEKANNEVDSITGATMSTNAFIDILNNEYEMYVKLSGGQN